jgi:hypothetical protein
VVTVKVEPAVPLATGVTEAGTRPQVTVALTGAIEQVNATAELNPLNEVTVILEVPPFPAMTVAVAGTAARLKSFNVKA